MNVSEAVNANNEKISLVENIGDGKYGVDLMFGWTGKEYVPLLKQAVELGFVKMAEAETVSDEELYNYTIKA